MWAAEPQDFFLFPQQLRQKAQVRDSMSLCAHIVQEAQHTGWVGLRPRTCLLRGKGSLNGLLWDYQPEVFFLLCLAEGRC